MKSKIFKKLIFLSFFVFFFLFSAISIVWAEAGQGFEEIGITIQDVYRVLLGFASIIAIAVLAFVGFRFMFSAGDPEAITDAKKYLLSLLIGLLIVIFSYALVRTLEVDVRLPRPPAPIIIPDPVPEEELVIEDFIPEEIEDLIPEQEERVPTEEELREDGFEGFVFREGLIDFSPLIIAGERVIIRDLTRVFNPRTGAFEDLGGSFPIMHSPRDKHGELIYRYGVILFEEPNFRGRCKIRIDRHGLVELGLGILYALDIDGFVPKSVRSFVMPMESHLRKGNDLIFPINDLDIPLDVPIDGLITPADNLIVHRHSVLEATYFRPSLKTKIQNHKIAIRAGEDIPVGVYYAHYRQFPIAIDKGVPIIPRHKDIDPQPFYSLETVFSPGKHMVILRYVQPGPLAPGARHYCYVTQTSISDFRNLWWAHAENPKAFFQEQVGELEVVGSPESIQVIQVLRVY